MRKPVLHVPLDQTEILLLVGALVTFLDQSCEADDSPKVKLATELRERLEEEYAELAHESNTRN